MNIALYWLLTVYLDKVMPNENGYREHPLFFFMPSYYGFKDPQWMRRATNDRPLPAESQPPEKEDVDVVAERQATKERASDDPTLGLKIEGLHKKYNKFTAINELSLTVNKGDLLALLGSNGMNYSLFSILITCQDNDHYYNNDRRRQDVGHEDSVRCEPAHSRKCLDFWHGRSHTDARYPQDPWCMSAV
jgi:hypothetical protein